jgi:hypothetical protein
MSSLPAQALQASRAAIMSALAEQPPKEPADVAEEYTTEPGEIQEIDMQAQAEGIRTVFNDPSNFNVKVMPRMLRLARVSLIVGRRRLASPLLTMDSLVRFAGNKRPQLATDSRLGVSADACAPDSSDRCRYGLDGGYQARH